MCVFKIKKLEEIDDLELDLIDYGLEEIVIDEDTKDIIIYAGFESYGDIQNQLEKKEIEIISSEIEKIPKNTVSISEFQRTEFENFIQMCEEDDDVQKIHHNA